VRLVVVILGVFDQQNQKINLVIMQGAIATMRHSRNMVLTPGAIGIVCDGSRRQGCSKFGKNEFHTHEAPSEENRIAAKAAWINKRDAENLRQRKSYKT
jgi:hypothetical protein